ncbi:hypothetical protein AV654_19685 [Paenibacillus elgii]|uniref:Restriction endonuclease type IV Mrr domain-containing protein n=2 Tax=Paenibacillus elgii TaxID=189691 RepID=A0A161S1W8_9BACL|nr:hypothetical protein AV654_19685 [Paenibacillus elgii]
MRFNSFRPVRRMKSKINRFFSSMLAFAAGVVGLTVIVQLIKKGTGSASSYKEDTILDTIISFFIAWGGWILGTGVFLFLAYRLVTWQVNKRRLLRSGFKEIVTMSGADFEDLLTLFFKEKGFAVKQTPRSRDFGADHILEKDGERTVVQAKRYKDKVSIDAVQEVIGAKGYYKATQAMVVTNSFYTDAAKKLAAANGVELWDRPRLIKELSDLNMASKKHEQVG